MQDVLHAVVAHIYGAQELPVATQLCELLQALVVRVDPVHELGAQEVALAV
jgi:hypothetical protein